MAKQKQRDDYDLDTPTGKANAVVWLDQHLRHIKDGGMWLIPRSGSAYEIRHSQKAVIKVMGFLPDPSLDTVFRAAGWKVTDNT